MKIVLHSLCLYHSISVIVQRDATLSSLFIISRVHSTCFGCQPHPSSKVHKTVTTASVTVHLPPSVATWPRWRGVAVQKIWPVPEAVVTVLCTPDDGCIWHPKHVEWTRRIINRLLCCISLDSYWYRSPMHGTINIKCITVCYTLVQTMIARTKMVNKSTLEMKVVWLRST